MVNKLVFIKDEKQLATVLSDLKLNIGRDCFLPLMPKAALAMLNNGFKQVQLPIDFLYKSEHDLIYHQSIDLSLSWEYFLKNKVTFMGIDLLECCRLQMLGFFQDILAAEIIIPRLISEYKPQEATFFKYPMIPSIGHAIHDGTADVFEAVLMWKFKKEGIKVNVLQIEQLENNVDSRREILCDSQKTTTDSDSLFSRRIKLINLPKNKPLIVGYGGGYDLLVIWPYIRDIAREIDGFPVLLNGLPACEFNTLRSGLVLDEDFRYVYVGDIPLIPMEKINLYEAYITCIGALKRNDILPEVLQNPLFTFQFEALWKDLVPQALQAAIYAFSFFTQYKTVLYLDDNCAGPSNRAWTEAANLCGVKTVTVPHGAVNLIEFHDFNAQWALSFGYLGGKNLALASPQKSNRIIVSGDPSMDRIKNQVKISTESKRSSVLLLTSGFLQQVWTDMDLKGFISTWEDIAKIALERPHIEFFIKTHPGVRDFAIWYKNFVKNKSISNIKVIDNQRLEELLSSAFFAVLIGKPSTAGLVSILGGVPFVYLDTMINRDVPGYRIWCDENGVPKLKSTAQLADMIDRVYTSELERNRLIEYNQRFLNLYLQPFDPSALCKQLGIKKVIETKEKTYKNKFSIHNNSIQMSVIIPTYNRASILYRALESIMAQTFPLSQYEVIVVDNNSTDNTREVVFDLIKKYGIRIRYFFEPTPGLVYARHRGAKEAKSEILVYCDDDIIASPGWLAAFHEAFLDNDIMLVGGKLVPDYEVTPPDWMKAFWVHDEQGSWNMYLGLIDLGNKIKQIPANYVFGGNCAIRKHILYECGGFHPDSLPQCLIRYRGDGESGLELEIQKRGYKVIYHPNALLKHYCPKSKMTVNYFCQRSFNEGISHSYTAIRSQGNLSGILKRDARDIQETEQFAFGILNKTFQFNTQSIEEIKQLTNFFYIQGKLYHQDLVLLDSKLLEYILEKDYFSPPESFKLHIKEEMKYNNIETIKLYPINKTTEEILLERAKSLFTKGMQLLNNSQNEDNIKKALAIFDESMYLYPLPEVQTIRAFCLLKLGRLNDAEAAIVGEIKRDINNHKAREIIKQIQQMRFNDLLKLVISKKSADLSWVDRSLLSLENAVIYITELCNSRCITCNFWKNKHEDRLNTETWKFILKQIRNVGISSIEFAGGEPLTRHDLPELIEESKKLGFSSIILSSNAFLLNKESIDLLTICGISNVHISLDGLRETYRYIRGVDWFEKVVSAISMLRSKAIPVLVLTTLTRQNIDELEEIVKLTQKLGAIWSINILENRKYGFKNIDLSPIEITLPQDIDNVIAVLKELRQRFPQTCALLESDVEYVKNYLQDPKRESKIPCTLGFRDIYLDPKGNVYSACMSMQPVGNAVNTPLIEIIDSAKMKLNIKAMLLRKCKGCTCGFSQRATLLSRVSEKVKNEKLE